MSKQQEPDTVPDKQLIAQVQRDDDMEAWEELMRRHSDKAFQIAYGIIGHRNDAEEVTQDAFVRIYRALARFRGDSEFSTWMYRIVVNQARNKYRWNKRRGAHLTVSIDQELEADDFSKLTRDVRDLRRSPAKNVMFNEWMSEIASEMEKLPAVNREALMLRNDKNLSYEQIAELLGCKVGTIKSRIARAREELRARLRT